MNVRNRTVFRIAITIAAIVTVLGIYYFRNPLHAKVRINGSLIRVEVALTAQQKSRGLGGRAGMDRDAGMLFPYDHKEQYEFWMKGMEFPLDFVWIDGRTVADISENVMPPVGSERPIIVKPAVPVDRVLELTAGSVKRFGIRVGDTVTYLDR